jgi:single-stranded DNA-binding protein
VWGGWAENLVKTVRKGSWVFVEGRLRQDQWVDNATGKKRCRLKVSGKRVFHFEPQYADSREPEDSEIPF